MEGEISELLKPISWLVGKWESVSGECTFPGIKDFSYKETIEFNLCGKQPLLAYSGKSSNPTTNMPMHLESGFLRSRDGKELSFMVSHNFGLTTLEEGTVDGKEIVLAAKDIARMSGSKDPSVVATQRKFKLDANDLVQEMSMATSKTPGLTPHLVARYVKI